MAFFGGGASVDLASPPAIGNTTPNTGAFTTLSFAPANNTTGFSNTSNSLTGSNSQSLINFLQTWNTTGTPSAILLNITDTASNANSNLINLQTGGTARFRVDKSGNVFANAFYVNANYNAQFTGFYGIFNGSTEIVAFSTSTNVGLNVRGTLPIGFCSGAPSGTDNDVRLNRDAANILALRYTTNAQTFRIYRTFTDTSNYERLSLLSTNTTRFSILVENAGTGAARSLEISFYTSASDPTSTDITSGCFSVWKNSGTGTIKLWANDGGTMKSVALA